MQFYKVCSKWFNEVVNNSASRVEWQAFIDGPDRRKFPKLCTDVFRRLGFSASFLLLLTLQTIYYTIYTLYLYSGAAVILYVITDK